MEVQERKSIRSAEEAGGELGEAEKDLVENLFKVYDK